MVKKHCLSAIYGAMASALLISPSILQAQVLEEVVVTAQRRVQSMQDVPISVFAITGQEIERQGFRDLRDFSAFEPTVQVDDRSAIGPTISIRGFGTTGNSVTLESAVPIFVDNIHYSRQSMLKTAFLDVEALEVLKGPQPVYFGQNATAGAFNIRSRRPGQEWEGSVSLEYGERANHNVTAAAGGPITDTLGIRAAISYNDDPGYITNIITQDKEGKNINLGGRITLQWQPTDALTVMAKLDKAQLRRDSEAHTICWDGTNVVSDIAAQLSYAPGEKPSQSVLVPAPFGAGWNIPHTAVPDDCYSTKLGVSAGGPFFAPPINTRNRDSTTGHPDVRLAAAGFTQNSRIPGWYERDVTSKQIEGYEDLDTSTSVLALNYAFDNEMTAEWTTGYVRYVRDYARDNEQAPFFSNWQGREEDYNQWSTEVRLNSAQGGTIEWEVGGFYQLGDLDVFSTSMGAHVRRGQRFNKVWEDQEWKSAFGVLTFNFLDNKASIDLGARYSSLFKETFANGYGATWIFDVYPCRPTNQDYLGGGNFDVNTCPVHPSAVPVTLADNPRIYDPNANLNNLWTIPYESPNNQLGRHTPSSWRGNRAHAVGLTAPTFTRRADSGPYLGDFSNDRIDPQVVLRYRPTDTMSTYARWAKAYKAGGFDTGQASLRGDDEGYGFGPEFAEIYELGLKGSIHDGRGRYDFNLFQTKFTDLQLSVSTASPDNRFQNLNAGGQRVRGLEFALAYAFTDQLRGGVNGAILDGVMTEFLNAPCTTNEVANAPGSGCVLATPTATTGLIDRTGQKAPNTPDWKFSFDLEYWMPVFNDYKTTFTTKAYISDGYCEQIGDCGAYRWATHGDINLNLSIGDMSDVWDLGFYVRNLLHPNEKVYTEELATPIGLNNESLPPSRFINYGIRLKYNFM